MGGESSWGGLLLGKERSGKVVAVDIKYFYFLIIYSLS